MTKTRAKKIGAAIKKWCGSPEAWSILSRPYTMWGGEVVQGLDGFSYGGCEILARALVRVLPNSPFISCPRDTEKVPDHYWATIEDGLIGPHYSFDRDGLADLEKPPLFADDNNILAGRLAGIVAPSSAIEDTAQALGRVLGLLVRDDLGPWFSPLRPTLVSAWWSQTGAYNLYGDCLLLPTFQRIGLFRLQRDMHQTYRTQRVAAVQQQLGATTTFVMANTGLTKHRGEGIGRAMYIEGIHLAARYGGMVIPARLAGGTTSLPARRLWQRLAEILPSVRVGRGIADVAVMGNAEFAPGGPNNPF